MDVMKKLLALSAPVLKATLVELQEARPEVFAAVMKHQTDRMVLRHDSIVRKIETLVCAARGVTPNKLRSRSRPRELVESRFINWHLINKHTNLSYSEIGRQTGGFDHGTIFHGLQRATALMDAYPEYRNQVDSIEQQFLAHLAAWLDSNQPAVAIAPARPASIHEHNHLQDVAAGRVAA